MRGGVLIGLRTKIEEVYTLVTRYQIRLEMLSTASKELAYNQELGEAIDHSIHLKDHILLPMLRKIEEIRLANNATDGTTPEQEFDWLITDYLKAWETGTTIWQATIKEKLGQEMIDLAFGISQQDVNGIRDHLKRLLGREP